MQGAFLSFATLSRASDHTWVNRVRVTMGSKVSNQSTMDENATCLFVLDER